MSDETHHDASTAVRGDQLDLPTSTVGLLATPSPQPVSPAADESTRWNIGRDVTAVILLVAALFQPWNVVFGSGVPGSSAVVFAALVVITLLAAAAPVAARYAVGARRLDPTRMRLLLSAPYLVLVAGFVGFTVVQAVGHGGSGAVPPGIGPGAWLGLAGALLAGQPALGALSDDEQRMVGWTRWLRVGALVATVLAFAAAVFNVFWRLEPVFERDSFSGTDLALIVLALVYGAAPLPVIVLGCGWARAQSAAARLAVVILGASALTAGFLIWNTNAGRVVDAFHGIAQSTSTAGVGYEGYLCWVAAAAIAGPWTLRATFAAKPRDEAVLRAATRAVLLLIAVWCVTSVVLRATDLIVSLSLNVHGSLYEPTALAAFDLVTTGLAIWLRRNATNVSQPAKFVTIPTGVLCALAVCRVVVGVALAPRVVFIDGAPPFNPVFGNDLAQQITGTFDVVVCGLAIGAFAIAVLVGHADQLRTLRAARTPATVLSIATTLPDEVNDSTVPQVASTDVAGTEKQGGIAVGATATTSIPRIMRQADAQDASAVDEAAGSGRHAAVVADVNELASAAPQSAKARAAQLLAESSKRFGAGTTYGGSSSQ